MAYLLLHKLPLLPLSLAEQYQSRYVAASYLTMCTTHYARPYTEFFLFLHVSTIHVLCCLDEVVTQWKTTVCVTTAECAWELDQGSQTRGLHHGPQVLVSEPFIYKLPKHLSTPSLSI